MSTFETLIADLTRDANRVQPQDALQWCSNWFQQRLEEQRSRSRNELARLSSYCTSLPNDHFMDTPIQSNRQLIEDPAARRSHRTLVLPPDIDHLSRTSEVLVRSEPSMCLGMRC
jgi:hypothetical protein